MKSNEKNGVFRAVTMSDGDKSSEIKRVSPLKDHLGLWHNLVRRSPCYHTITGMNPSCGMLGLDPDSKPFLPLHEGGTNLVHLISIIVLLLVMIMITKMITIMMMMIIIIYRRLASLSISTNTVLALWIK